MVELLPICRKTKFIACGFSLEHEPNHRKVGLHKISWGACQNQISLRPSGTNSSTIMLIESFQWKGPHTREISFKASYQDSYCMLSDKGRVDVKFQAAIFW